MSLLSRSLEGSPPPARYAVISALILGGLGGLTGLVLGLWAYPPTAWFAVLEVGVPAAAAGAAIGAVVGFIQAQRSRPH